MKYLFHIKCKAIKKYNNLKLLIYICIYIYIYFSGKIYHKSTLLKSRPYLMLCLPISIDDCSYIYSKVRLVLTSLILIIIIIIENQFINFKIYIKINK